MITLNVTITVAIAKTLDMWKLASLLMSTVMVRRYGGELPCKQSAGSDSRQ